MLYKKVMEALENNTEVIKSEGLMSIVKESIMTTHHMKKITKIDVATCTELRDTALDFRKLKKGYKDMFVDLD